MAVALQAVYPTEAHAQAADAVVDFFSERPEVDAVILMGSCARGKASVDSCVDFLVLASPDVAPIRLERLELRWRGYYEVAAAFKALREVGRYAHVDLDFADGTFKPRPRGWTSGPDAFELEIGNTLVYSVPLWDYHHYLDDLKARWLPYYDDDLRAERLETVHRYALNNLDHIPLYTDRGLYFQSFHRLCDAFQEFLQALFMTKRTYPIAYNKWIQEQIVEILEMPELYDDLTRILEIGRFEGRTIADKARDLRGLFDRYTLM